MPEVGFSPPVVGECRRRSTQSALLPPTKAKSKKIPYSYSGFWDVLNTVEKMENCFQKNIWKKYLAQCSIGKSLTNTYEVPKSRCLRSVFLRSMATC